MKYELELELSNIGKLDLAYSKEKWYLRIDSLLDDFQKFIGYNFERNTKDDITLNLQYPTNPSFITGLWTPEETKQNNTYSHKWLDLVNNDLLKIESENYLLSVKWSAVMSGCLIGAGVKKNQSHDFFNINITVFLYHPINGKRLSLESGEDLIGFSFTPQSDGSGEWKSLGWLEDIYGEWKNRKSWFD